MKRILALVRAGIDVFTPGSPLQARQQILSFYLLRVDGERREKAGDALGARVDFDELLYFLLGLQRAHPDWETSLVNRDISDAKNKIATLEPSAAAQALEGNTLANAAAHHHDGLRLETTRQDEQALHEFETCLMMLELIRSYEPGRKSGLIQQEIAGAETKTVELRARLLPLTTEASKGGTLQ